MIEKLLNYEIQDLLEYIKNLDTEKRLIILSNNEIKKKFIFSENDYPFIWLIQSLSKIELDVFFDKECIDNFINSNNFLHMMNGLLNLDSKINYGVLSNKEILNQIYKNFDEFRQSLYSLDERFVQNFFEYIINNNLDINKISKCSKNLHKVFSDKKNLEIIIERSLISTENINKFDISTISELLKYDYFKDIILCDEYDLSDLIFKGIIFSDELIQDKRLKEKLISIKDPDEYRFIMFELEKSNNIDFVAEIENLRCKYYDEIINSYDADLDMFSNYIEVFNLLIQDNKLVDQDILFKLDLDKKIIHELIYDINIIFFNREKSDEEKIFQLKQLFSKQTRKDFNKILVDRFFRDVSYNFMLDLDNLISFNEENVFISNYNLEKYKKIKMLYDNCDIDINFYNELNTLDNQFEYYDDFLMSRQESYRQINECLINFDTISEQRNRELSEKFQVDIYEFKGEPFYALIHNTSHMKDESDNADQVFEKHNIVDGISLSLISHDRIDYFHDNYNSIVVGFNNMDINNFVHVYNSDSFSLYNRKKSTVSKKVNKLYSPKSLMLETVHYNEIVYQVKTVNNKGLNVKKIVPSYVVVFDDKITEMDLAVAKKFNIPIINIEKEKYKKFSDRLEDPFNNSYVNSYCDLKNRRK